MTREDKRQDFGEERLVFYGLLATEVVVMVYTERPKGPHVISLQKPEKHEARYYRQVAKAMRRAACHCQGLVSLQRIVEELRGLHLSAKDLLSFQRWVMFNYLIGNSDTHAKNVSVMVDETGYALAPFYDLLCVQVYGDDRLALYFSPLPMSSKTTALQPCP